MTIFMNVTDAIGRASNHGITRVERQLATELLHRPDVQFVVSHRDRLWRLPNAAVAPRLVRYETNEIPCIERFGVPKAPTRCWEAIHISASMR